MTEHAPGWYEHRGERRYWDGSRWTHATSVPSSTLPPAPYPAAGTMVPASAPNPYGHRGYPGAIPIARKEPGLALLASFLVPGAGSMINGDVGAGVVFLGLYLVGWVLVLCLGVLIVGLVGVPIALVAWIGSMVHAYRGAVNFNIAAGYTA